MLFRSHQSSLRLDPKPWTARHAAENVQLHPARLDHPLRWQKPRRIFVDSMSDLFHDQIPDSQKDVDPLLDGRQWLEFPENDKETQPTIDFHSH